MAIKYGNFTLEESMDPEIDIIPKKFLSFAGYNEGFLCINLNNGNDYGKIYWVTESGEIELVAASFDEFMERLTDDPDE